MKNLYIHCDGGFGNRFNSLVVGLLICERGNFNPIISWPSTNVCRAFYGDIFKEQFESISNRLEDYSDSIDEFEFIMHDNQLSWNVVINSPYSFTRVEEIISHYNKSTKDKLFYFNNIIPNYIDLDLSLISKLMFKEVYYNAVNNFLKHEDYVGVHLRSTDFPQGSVDFEGIYNSIKKSSRMHFVCSDSFEVEDKFNQLDNVFTFSKSSYVEKIDESFNWRVNRGQIKDEMEKALSFNVERSSDSVKEAIVDLLVLSKSDIMITSSSTFLQTAQLLNRYLK